MKNTAKSRPTSLGTRELLKIKIKPYFSSNLLLLPFFQYCINVSDLIFQFQTSMAKDPPAWLWCDIRCHSSLLNAFTNIIYYCSIVIKKQINPNVCSMYVTQQGQTLLANQPSVRLLGMCKEAGTLCIDVGDINTHIHHPTQNTYSRRRRQTLTFPALIDGV